MARSRMSPRRPVNSRKNIFQAIDIIAAAGTDTTGVVDAEDTMPAIADTNGVVTGAIVNTIYLEVWMYGNAVAGVNSPITWMLAKNPGNNLTLPDPAAAGASDNKRWIFAMGKGLIGNQGNGQPGYLIRGWFSVPKKMRRFGHDDALQLVVKNDTANDVNICIMCIYKWYF